MSKIIILKNQTIVDIELPELGETIPASGNVDVSNYTARDLRDEPVLLAEIASGDIVVNDGTMDFDFEIGRDYISNDSVSDEDGFWYGKRRRFTVLWNQVGHGFLPGQVIKLNESTGTAVLAQANSHANSSTSALVQEVIDANSFYAGLSGAVIKDVDASSVTGGLPLVPGKAYFLSTTVPGQVTATVPPGAGEIVKLVGLATDIDALMVFSFGGYANETALGNGPGGAAQIAAIQGSGNLIRTPNTWLPAVDDIKTDPTVGAPFTNGDRFYVGVGAVGDWAGQDNKVAEFVASSSTWHYTTPVDGTVIYVRSLEEIYQFNGTIWKLLDQNIFETIAADTGSTTAATTTDTLNVVGGNKITTSITGDTLTIDWDVFSITDLGAGYNDNDVIQFNSSTDEFEVVQLDHNTLTNIGTNTHATIDTHIADTANPHGTTIANLDDTTIASLINGQGLIYNSISGMWENITLAVGGSGRIIQVQFGPIAAVASTASIPIGASAPLITEGVEIWSQTITPQELTSNMRIGTAFSIEAAANNTELVVAFFRDSVCIATGIVTATTKKFSSPFSTTVYDPPNTITPVVYSCRVGKNSGTTWYLNRTEIAGLLGNTLESQAFTIEEIGIS